MRGMWVIFLRGISAAKPFGEAAQPGGAPPSVPQVQFRFPTNACLFFPLCFACFEGAFPVLCDVEEDLNASSLDLKNKVSAVGWREYFAGDQQQFRFDGG